MSSSNPLFEMISFGLGLIDYGFLLLKILGPAQPKFFKNGYDGSPAYREELAKTYSTKCPLSKSYLTEGNNKIDWGTLQTETSVTVQDGRFVSPGAADLPVESKHAHFQLVRPSGKGSEKEQAKLGGVYVFMFPATGETDNFVRLSMARQLAKKYGWSSVILTAPFYAERQPEGQTLFFLNSVKELLAQTEGIIQEATSLAAYLMKQSPKTRICFTGFSYGAAMAGVASNFALSAGLDGQRLASAPYVGSSSPCVLSDGVLESSVNYGALRRAKEVTRDETSKELFDELYKTQMTVLGTNEGKGLKVVKAIAMAHDAFIKPFYAREFEDQIKLCLDDTFEMQWYPGGHAFAAVMRPFLHNKLVIETVQELLRD